MKNSINILLGLTLVLIGVQAQAVPCSDTDTGIFLLGTAPPSPPTVETASFDCEDGSGSNDPFPSDYVGFPDMSFDALQKISWEKSKDEPFDPFLETSTEVDIGLVVTPGPGQSTSGTWSFINSALYDTYVIVLKDGGAGSGDPQVKWSAYLLDSTLDAFSATTGSTWAGDWIYGYGLNGKLKELSHLSVYGKAPDRPPGEGEVPAPGVLALFGLGLALLGARRRKRIS